MQNKSVLKWLGELRTLEDLQKNFYPTLIALNEAAWSESNLISPTGENDISGGYHQLTSNDILEFTAVLRYVSEEDLSEAQTLSSLEIEARKALVSLDWAQAETSNLYEQAKKTLRKLQSVRQLGILELERRARQESVAKGTFGPLDALYSRILFGNDPQPYQSKGMIEPKPREFFMVRVPSGKLAAVSQFYFSIPNCYNQWLHNELIKTKVIEQSYLNSYWTPGPWVNYKTARVYFNMGFKPGPDIKANFSIDHPTWAHNWVLNRSRTYKSSQLVPVD